MIEKKEVLRYLRASSNTDDPELLRLIDEATQHAYKEIKPKSIYEIFDCSRRGDEVKIGSFTFKSKRFAENMNGCKKAVVFAVTLGTESDRLLRSASAKGASALAIYQAVLAAICEEECDALEEHIKKTHGVNLKKRYSAGYFDLSIENQKKIFQMMDITKRIGITLTDTFLMIPSKSVTAFIGIEYED